MKEESKSLMMENITKKLIHNFSDITKQKKKLAKEKKEIRQKYLYLKKRKLKGRIKDCC